MDEQLNQSNPPENPRRKRRTQEQIIKENYLPAIIAGVALILVLVFIIGSVTRAVAKRKHDVAESKAAYESSVAQDAAWEKEVIEVLKKVDTLVANYDYEGAVKTMEGFSGNISRYPDLSAKYTQCVNLRDNAVAWDDPNDVLNLSFHPLIADPHRAFNHNTRRNSYNRDYVTVEEFQKILQQMYENGYVLVSMEDIVEYSTDDSGKSSFAAKTLYLPEGKKPFMITETNVNYYTNLIDSDGDFVADAGGGGLASKLVLDGEGNIQAEYVDAEGNILVGAYELVPVLENFIAEHPGFSYKNARATLAVSGYDGVFGYRVDADGLNRMGETAYAEEVKKVKELAQALRDKGYVIASYTYGMCAYGTMSATEIQADLNKWTAEITPILGEVNTLVMAKMSDISNGAYSGSKYDTLRDFGFQYYMGFSSAGGSWADVTQEYVRQGRVMVTGANLKHNSEWFDGLFKVDSILDPSRGSIPEP